MDYKILLKTEEDIETCFLLLQESKIISQELSSNKKLLSKITITESILLNMFHHSALFQVLKLIRDWALLIQKDKIGQKVWMLFQLWLNNSINSDADLLNGEQFLPLDKAFHHNKLFNKTLGDLQDMQQSVNKMV